MAEDDGSAVAWDDEDTADDAREDGVGTAISIDPEVYPTAIDLHAVVLAMLMHAEGAEDRVRATDRSWETALVLRKG